MSRGKAAIGPDGGQRILDRVFPHKPSLSTLISHPAKSPARDPSQTFSPPTCTTKKRMACWRNPSQPRARADLLINIVRAGAEGNHELFRPALEALITKERSKQHHVLADLLLPAAIRQAFAPPNSNPATACFPSTTLSLHKGWWPAT